MSTIDDIRRIRDELGWSLTRIGAHYKVSERQVKRWMDDPDSYDIPSLSPPIHLDYGTAFIVNDAQFPYHDPALWEVACQVARDAEADLVLWDGDMLDFQQLGSYNHDSYRMQTAEHEVDRFHEELREPLLSGLDNPREMWSNGNHEYRYERYINHNDNPTGTSLFPSMRNFLKLPEHVSFKPWGKASGHLLTPKLLVCHGWYARKHSAYTAKGHAEEVGSLSLICGHSHRVGQYHKTTPEGVQASYEVGHMCDVDKVPKSREGWQNWQQVCGTLVRYKRNGDSFNVNIVGVFGDEMDKAIANDRVYTIDR